MCSIGKMMDRVVWLLVTLLATLLLLVSCKRATTPSSQEKQIAFHTEWQPLRSGIVSTATFYEEMAVSAWLSDPNEWALGSFYFKDLKVTKASNYNSGYPWLGNSLRHFTFIAIAPYDASLTLTDALRYEIENSTGDKDIVVALTKEIPSGGPGPVPLHFKHILSGVTLVMHPDSRSMEVHKATFTNQHLRGKYQPFVGQWSNLEGEKDFEQTIGVTHTKGGTTDTQLVQNPLFLIPGTPPIGAQLLLEVTPEGAATRENISIELAHYHLAAGRHYIIRLYQEEEGVPLTYEILPWDREIRERDFLKNEDIEFLEEPTYTPADHQLTDDQNEFSLTFTLLRPIGVRWSATLTNGLDFKFKEGTPRSGVTRKNEKVTITLVPRQPQGKTARSTELYLTLDGKEIDPDRHIGGDGPIGRGKGNRHLITQKAL